MTADILLEELKELGVEVTPHGENLVIRPASKVPADLKERLRRHKPEIVEEIYHLRAECVLQEICRNGAPGMILWLADHSPLLHYLLTDALLDRVSTLWAQRAALQVFDRALADLRAIYFLADLEYREMALSQREELHL